MAENKKYDVGILGVWMGCNYGSIMTYYALNQAIKALGYSVLMVDKILPANKGKDAEYEMTHSRRFAKEHYDIAPPLRLSEMNRLNELCDTFVIGSDQVWNYGISKHSGRSFYLDFADSTKKKIAYATSFGHAVDFAPENERRILSALMQRFDAISLREGDGVKLCNEVYGVEATRVLDPVFLVDPEKVYKPLIAKSKKHEDEPFIAAYILDPTPEKKKALQHASKKLGGIKIINLLDGFPWLFAENKRKMDMDNCIEDLQVEDWLYYLSNASFVVTDSCHGASFAMIFKKNFIAITNKKRGYSRFKSLADVFGVRNRIVTEPEMILTNESLFEPVDYDTVDQIMKSEARRSTEWLKCALEAEKKPEPAGLDIPQPVYEEPKPETSMDFDRCKMLVTMIKEYGIKHVVLSSGSRNLNMVRMFEADPFFKTYSVIDERSAGFYAMGLALKLNETVAMCCTSGTAASNYLTSVTEAYYQGVPLVVITADRYPCVLGQNEDQTIPQSNIYGSVVKKSVTLPVTPGTMGDWEARRLVCEALLEVDHHGKGPVHINIPIANIERPKPEPRLLRLDKVFRKIDRIDLGSEERLWQVRVNRLKQMKRVLIVYGQNHPLSEEEKALVDTFAEKFNCVIATDALSNYSGKYAVPSTPVLRNYDNDRFDEALWADVVITIGGRRSLNDPIIPRLRAQKKPMGHWRVSEDGRVADTFRKLNRIFECSQAQFLKKFIDMSGDCKNNGEYLEAWKNAQKDLPSEHINSYSQLYATDLLIQKLPKNSLLHLAIGCTIMFANRYDIDPSVNVFCNMGTNGIDGSASTFMGHAAVSDEPCFLLISDLSFFYDMNSIWDKHPRSNVRIMLCNNSGTNLLRHLQSNAITHAHSTSAKGWVEENGFRYISASDKDTFHARLDEFVGESDKPIFFEVFC